MSKECNEVQELHALLILTLIPYLGSMRIQALIEKFGSASAVLELSASEIANIAGFGAKIAPSWGNWKKEEGWKRQLELADKKVISLVPYFDVRYPKHLKAISDYPILLYVKGNLTLIENSIAIVGTRNATIYGKEIAEQLGKELASMGYTVVSGLARGIDTAAHLGALQVKEGRTVGVLGSGINCIYPQENKQLSEAMVLNGALVSEFSIETPPDRLNFPRRNRIVAGMTKATVLIEAPLKSGAMITMDFADRYKKHLFAFPGRVDWECFKGNHHLIKQGKAHLIEEAKDIAFLLGDKAIEMKPSFEKKHVELLNEQEKRLWEVLPYEEVTVDEIIGLIKGPVSKVQSLLMSLVIKKFIKEYPGKIYKKIR